MRENFASHHPEEGKITRSKDDYNVEKIGRKLQIFNQPSILNNNTFKCHILLLIRDNIESSVLAAKRL